jgi:hypothetical protein
MRAPAREERRCERVRVAISTSSFVKAEGHGVDLAGEHFLAFAAQHTGDDCQKARLELDRVLIGENKVVEDRITEGLAVLGSGGG